MSNVQSRNKGIKIPKERVASLQTQDQDLTTDIGTKTSIIKDLNFDLQAMRTDNPDLKTALSDEKARFTV